MSMKSRCNNSNGKMYCAYGGRGITVCPEWNNSFKAFLRDMCEKPGADYDLHRVDPDGNYEKDNCEWTEKGEHFDLHNPIKQREKLRSMEEQVERAIGALNQVLKLPGVAGIVGRAVEAYEN